MVQSVGSIRKRLRAGGHAVGSWINSGSPIVAELMAVAGFDFLTVDVEHSAVGVAQTQQLLQAIRSGNPSCASLVRLPSCDYALSKRFLDAGADGVIAPLVNSAEQAREVVQAAKYPPLGSRGVGFCRDNQYGINLSEKVAVANGEKLVAVQIEHIDGVRNIDAILDTEGVDAVFIGPYDLSASMGLTGQLEHQRMIEAKDAVLDACRRHRIVPGIHIVSPDVREVMKRFSEGYRLLAFSLDITILTSVCLQSLEEIRKALPGAQS